MTNKLSIPIVLFLSSVSVLANPGVIARAERPVRGIYVVVLADFDVIPAAARAADLAAPFGGRITAVWEHAVRGFAVKLTEGQALALSHSPFVKWVEEDGYGEAITTQPTWPQRWGLDRIDQRNLPLSNSYSYCQDGTGVNIYVVDTGVWYLHTEFELPTGGSTRVTTGPTFCSGGLCTGSAHNPCDSGSTTLQHPLAAHGTMVASVAVGILNGVAKNATVIPVRAGDCFGTFQRSWVISAVDWVVADHDAGERAVMNCSFKVAKLNNSQDDAVITAFNRVINDGVVVVVGAGNENNHASSTLLPNIDRVITVGASTAIDERWIESSTVGSNYDSLVDIFAPGQSIRVANTTSRTAMVYEDGTSLSAPFVAGVVAQYLQSNPTATTDDVFSWVINSATQGVLTSVGAGSPNRLLYSSCN